MRLAHQGPIRIQQTGRPSPSSAINQPFALINNFGDACEHDFAIVLPANIDSSARRLNFDLPVGKALDHRSYSGGTGTCPRSCCLANSALPNAQLDLSAVEDMNE